MVGLLPAEGAASSTAGPGSAPRAAGSCGDAPSMGGARRPSPTASSGDGASCPAEDGRATRPKPPAVARGVGALNPSASCGTTPASASTLGTGELRTSLRRSGVGTAALASTTPARPRPTGRTNRGASPPRRESGHWRRPSPPSTPGCAQPTTAQAGMAAGSGALPDVSRRAAARRRRGAHRAPRSPRAWRRRKSPLRPLERQRRARVTAAATAAQPSLGCLQRGVGGRRRGWRGWWRGGRKMAPLRSGSSGMAWVDAHARQPSIPVLRKPAILGGRRRAGSAQGSARCPSPVDGRSSRRPRRWCARAGPASPLAADRTPASGRDSAAQLGRCDGGRDRGGGRGRHDRLLSVRVSAARRAAPSPRPVCFGRAPAHPSLERRASLVGSVSVPDAGGGALVVAAAKEAREQAMATGIAAVKVLIAVSAATVEVRSGGGGRMGSGG